VAAFHVPLYFNTPVTAELIAVCIWAPVAKLEEEELTVPVFGVSVTDVVPVLVNVLVFPDATLVTPELELVPAPISVLTSAALIPELRVGVLPFESIAGVPESVTLRLFLPMSDAWVAVIVVILPALAVVEVVPITRLDDPFPVPAPIRVLISAADIPEFNDGVVPLDKTAGTPVSDTFLLLFTIAVACAEVIVVVLPAIAVVDVVPITKLEVPLPVPAPIRDLTSAPDIPVFKEGVEPLDNIAGLPVSGNVLVIVIVPPLLVDVISDVIPVPWAIVKVSPLVTEVDSVPLPSFIVQELIDPEPVPAPINVLTSAPVTPEAKVGVPPPLNIPGSA